MRLIDADGLTEGRVENDPVVIAAKCAPTAYDPDKVVEQLEERTTFLKECKKYGKVKKLYVDVESFKGVFDEV